MEDSIGDSIIVRIAVQDDFQYAPEIVAEMEASSKARGTGISKRSPESICNKIQEGEAVIALTSGGTWVGFMYMNVWANGQFVSHNGLIVSPKWRNMGVATAMKEKIFDLSRLKYPRAKIFGITTSLATMKINSRLGLKPVTFSEIVREKAFWNKCKSCIHYKDLKNANFKNCFCTAMLFDPCAENREEETFHNRMSRQLLVL